MHDFKQYYGYERCECVAVEPIALRYEPTVWL
jgi:hypothetical protein